MPLFRFHRATLEESLTTTLLVGSLEELRSCIDESMAQSMAAGIVEYDIDVDVNYTFDRRCGWYSRYVKVRCKDENMGWFVVGVLSEPFESNYNAQEHEKEIKIKEDFNKNIKNLKEIFDKQEDNNKKLSLSNKKVFNLVKNLCLYDNDRMCSRCNTEDVYMFVRPDHSVIEGGLCFCYTCSEVILSSLDN